MSDDYAEILSVYAAAMEAGVRRPRLVDIADAAGVSMDRVQVIADAAVEARHLRSFRNGRPVCYAITPDGMAWLTNRSLSAQGPEGSSCLVKGCAFKPLDTIPLCGAHERQLPGSLRSRWWSKRKAKALHDMREWAKTATVAPAATRPTTLARRPPAAKRPYSRAVSPNTCAILAALAAGDGDYDAATAAGVSVQEVIMVRRDWGLIRKYGGLLHRPKKGTP